MLRQSFNAIANRWPLLTFFYHLFYSAEWDVNFSHKPFLQVKSNLMIHKFVWFSFHLEIQHCCYFQLSQYYAIDELFISMHDPVQSLWFICQNNHHSLTKFNIWFYEKIFYYYCLKNWTIWNVTWSLLQTAFVFCRSETQHDRQTQCIVLHKNRVFLIFHEKANSIEPKLSMNN